MRGGYLFLTLAGPRGGSDEAASECPFCPTGKFASSAGTAFTSGCQDCPSGQGSSSDFTSCESCTSGTYGPAAGVGYFQCGRGKHSDAVGATAETQCQEVFMVMTFLLLPVVSVKIFSTFACREFDGE
ncbi:hypothetical protein TrLO_g12220 [Triparma laevis f. longispina]|uniref:Tyrosine-protein kinase ephrin type A/B receptor-like domain-containing protein n=1 Tax=Triparma laevis f. longispina TaxID=1714387 RepID=A0A9W7FNA6_9STRA|nr:hypothetical protein TrLO_g12220 [Triparma laevis f. longispina]